MNIIKYKEQWDWCKLIHIQLITEDKIPKHIGRLTIEISKDYLKITGVYIENKYRNQGYASILMKLAIEEIKTIKHKTNYLYLLVRTDNEPAIKVYKKCKFKHYSYSEFKNKLDYYQWMRLKINKTK